LTPDPAAVAVGRAFATLAEQVFSRMPLYRRLCQGAADDLEVAARVLVARPGQRIPNLLLAAVHDVLLGEGHDDPLAAWYPSVPARWEPDSPRARPVGHGDDDPWPHFRRLALEHPTVEARLTQRVVQTNEVGRLSAVIPALHLAGTEAPSAPPGGPRPLGIVDVGSSAGLNLWIDRYAYRYLLRSGSSGGDVGEELACIGPHAGLVLRCQLRGSTVPTIPTTPPPVDHVVGLDRDPLDLHDPDDARWLVACAWPEDHERLDRLRQAIAVAQHDSPVVIRGDATADVARLVRAVPPSALPVVIATWTLAYLTAPQQRAFFEELDSVAEDRDLALVYAEQPERVPGLVVPPRPDGAPDGRPTALVLVQWHGGERRAHRLADMHPHGRWLEWLHR
jgi:hypothetical protein